MHSTGATIYASQDRNAFFNHDASKLFNLKIQSSLVLKGKCSDI